MSTLDSRQRRTVVIDSNIFMRRLIALALAAVATACGGGTTGTPDPQVAPLTALAADQVVFGSTRASSNRELFVMKADGSRIQRLTTHAAYEHWWPRISPDRKKILFYRRPAGVAGDDYAQDSLWQMNADGSGITPLLAQGANGWAMQGHAEWSPDGTRIAMFGSFNATLQVFLTDATGGNAVRYTNQPGINTDVSWSPDGSKLLFNGCPALPCSAANSEIFVMSATAPLSTATRLTTDGLADYDPYFSPDGSAVAWLTNTNPAANGGLGAWGIRIASIGGGTVSSLSNLRTLIDDGQINSKPAWSLDGSTIFFHRINFAEEAKFGVFKIKSDGTQTQPTRLTDVSTGVNEFPSN